MGVSNKMKKFFHYPQFLRLKNIADIQKVREEILSPSLRGASFIGAVIYILATILSVIERNFLEILIYTLSYSSLLAVTFLPHIQYRLRVYILLFSLYILGFYNMVLFGIDTNLSLFSLVYIIITVLFLEFRLAIKILALGSVGVMLFRFLRVQKYYALNFRPSQSVYILRVIGITATWLVGFGAIIYIGVFLSVLSKKLKKAEEISSILEKKNKDLEESELHFRNLVETSPNAIIRFNMQGTIEATNLAVEILTGYHQAEILGENISMFLRPEKKNFIDDTFKWVSEKGVVRDYRISVKHKNGALIFVELNAAPILDSGGNTTGVIVIGQDITEKTRAEEILKKKTEEAKINRQKLRALTHQLISAQENERRIIARELHDDAGQALITLRHGINIVLEELNAGKDVAFVKKRLKKNLELAEQAMTYVRSASHRLRPPALEVGGINVGLEELCSQFSLQTHLQTSYNGTNLLEIPDDLSISFYRFVQEALTNILKHTNASKVIVNLAYQDDRIILSVEDNGSCTKKEDTQQSEGTGLLGLQERFALFLGKIETSRNEAQGFLITVTVPWAKEIAQ